MSEQTVHTIFNDNYRTMQYKTETIILDYCVWLRSGSHNVYHDKRTRKKHKHIYNQNSFIIKTTVHDPQSYYMCTSVV